MRKFIIDTDTASDDAIAIIAALKEPQVEVLALTVVAGNVLLEQATQNALISIEMADTYLPPVFKGAAKPLYRDLVQAANVHGSDGLGNMHLPCSKLQVESMHAVDALIHYIEKYPYEIELITLGPLTNIALAIQKAPQTMKKLKSIVLMAGNGFGPGNVTKYAEFNVYVDAEALNVVLDLAVEKLFVGWDAISKGAFISEADLKLLGSSDAKLAQFAIRCTQSLYEFQQRFGAKGFELADPTAMLLALYPDVLTHKVDVYAHVEDQCEVRYGEVVLKTTDESVFNATICTDINSTLFKNYLFKLLMG